MWSRPQLGKGDSRAIEPAACGTLHFQQRTRAVGTGHRVWGYVARHGPITQPRGGAGSPIGAVCSPTTKRRDAAVLNSVCSVRIVESAAHDWHTRPIARRATPARRCGRISRKLMNDAPILKYGHATDSADEPRRALSRSSSSPTEPSSISNQRWHRPPSGHADGRCPIGRFAGKCSRSYWCPLFSPERLAGCASTAA